MATVGSLLQDLARRTRPDRAAAWDPVGLQFGDPERAVGRVAVCHEVDAGVAAGLVENPPDLVVAYHPLLFRGTTRLVAGSSPEGRAWQLIDAGVALAVTHTDFDAAPGGTADALAERLDIDEVQPFGSVEPGAQIKVVTFVPEKAVDGVAAAMAAAGAGRIGNYESCSFRVAGHGTFAPGVGAQPVAGEKGRLNTEPEVRVEMIAPRPREQSVVAALLASHPYEEPAFDVYDVRSNLGAIGRVGNWVGDVASLAETVRSRLGDFGLRVAGRPGWSIRRVAVVPGSGSSFLSAAATAGADALVTGDVDHHRAAAALDAGVAVVDPGHAATEQPGMRRLVEVVTELGVEVEDLVGDGAGPWQGEAFEAVP